MFDHATAEKLAAYQFDSDSFLYLQKELREGRFGPERNRVAQPVAATEAGDVMPWKQAGGAAELARAKEMMAAGAVAVAVLNGGMATRFGGRVKGVVEVRGQDSFLALKLRQVHAAAPAAQVFIMNSFATDADTRAHLAAHRHFGLSPKQVHLVTQRISLRLRPTGELFTDAHGAVSFYAPGHGDLFGALAGCAAFARLAGSGAPLVAVSNVDNLGATLDARVIAAHLAGGRPLTCEVAERRPGDAGGAPVRLGGQVVVLEEFRLPRGFDAARLPVFNTNSFVFDAAAMHPRHQLSWFRADKKVDGAPAVQFERLLGEATALLPSTYLQVPRGGADGRFLPVKTPGDLEAMRPEIARRLAAAR